MKISNHWFYVQFYIYVFLNLILDINPLIFEFLNIKKVKYFSDCKILQMYKYFLLLMVKLQNKNLIGPYQYLIALRINTNKNNEMISH